ncbi:MAG: glycosyltransferase family 39 protein [Planctomycetia bacterium]|nr:glycosyltransferase family 39 protein [Planctomycetia bacterium]
MRRHLATLALLLALSAAVQAWTVSHAVVPAQDVLRFVAAARSIDRDGLAGYLRQGGTRPLFPAFVCAVKRCAVERFWGPWNGERLESPSANDDGDISEGQWAFFAQFASAAMLVLCLVPLYCLLLRIVRPAAAIAGCLLFCVLGEAARLGADGLADSTHLFFLACAVAALFAGWSSRGASRYWPAWLLSAGACIALAAMARREALLVVPVWLVTEGILQLRRRWREPARRLLAAAAAMALGFAAGASPLWLAPPADPVQSMWMLAARNPGEFDAADAAEQPSTRAWKWRTDAGKKMQFPRKDPAQSLRFSGYTAAAEALVHDAAKSTGYFGAVLAPIGLLSFWRSRRTTRDCVPATPDTSPASPRLPQCLFIVLFGLAYGLACFGYAAEMGYLAPRHLLPPAMLLFGWIGAGAIAVGEGVGRPFQAIATARKGHPTISGALAVVLLAAICLPQTLEPLHASRQAHAAAGRWLADHAARGDVVLDTRGWTGLFSGCPTHTYDDAKTVFADWRLAFVVLESGELAHESRRSETLRTLLAHAGTPVAVFPASASSPHKTVEVYRWDPDRFDERFARGKRKTNAQLVGFGASEVAAPLEDPLDP